MPLRYGAKPAEIQNDAGDAGGVRPRLARALGKLIFLLMLGLSAVIMADRLFAPQFAARPIHSAGWTIVGLAACLIISLMCFFLAWRTAQRIKTALEEPSDN